jgi:hypothetical protein
MRLHQNARTCPTRTCPNCRRVIIRQIREQGRRIADVAADFKGTRPEFLRRGQQLPGPQQAHRSRVASLHTHEFPRGPARRS